MAKVTAAEHIQNLENKRAATMARMTEIMEATADDGETLADDQAAEHDRLALDVKSLDADLQRWRELERMQLTQARPCRRSRRHPARAWSDVRASRSSRTSRSGPRSFAVPAR